MDLKIQEDRMVRALPEFYNYKGQKPLCPTAGMHASRFEWLPKARVAWINKSQRSLEVEFLYSPYGVDASNRPLGTISTKRCFFESSPQDGSIVYMLKSDVERLHEALQKAKELRTEVHQLKVVEATDNYFCGIWDARDIADRPEGISYWVKMDHPLKTYTMSQIRNYS